MNLLIALQTWCARSEPLLLRVVSQCGQYLRKSDVEICNSTFGSDLNHASARVEIVPIGSQSLDALVQCPHQSHRLPTVRTKLLQLGSRADMVPDLGFRVGV